jgi:hypothetical protein
MQGAPAAASPKAPRHARAPLVREQRQARVRIGRRLGGVRLDALDLEAEPAQPILDDPLRALLVAENAPLSDEPGGQVV